jgi:hypothetical protein
LKSVIKLLEKFKEMYQKINLERVIKELEKVRNDDKNVRLFNNMWQIIGVLKEKHLLEPVIELLKKFDEE